MAKHYNGFTPQQRQKAFNWLKRQYANGNRARPTQCGACGQDVGVCHHSEDYSYPYGDNVGEFELCFACHMWIHNRKNRPDNWDIYKARIAAGYVTDFCNNWPTFRSWYLSTGTPIYRSGGLGNVAYLERMENYQFWQRFDAQV